jgi:hypothetical protein
MLPVLGECVLLEGSAVNMKRNLKRITVFLMSLMICSSLGWAAPNADQATSLYRSGIEQMRQGRWQKAIIALEKASSLAPERASIQEALGGAYFNYEIELSPQILIFSDQSTSTQSSENAQRVIKLEKAAESALKKSVALDPSNAGYHHTLGWFYLASYWVHLFDPAGRADQIKVKESSDQDPKDQNSIKKTDSIDYTKLAIQELKAATQFAPKVAEYHRSLADAYRLIGEQKNIKAAESSDGTIAKSPDEDRALAEYRVALQLKPFNAPLCYLMYRRLDKGGSEPSDEALAYLIKACQIDRTNALYGYELARSLFVTGQNEEAFNTLRYANMAPRFDSTYSPAYPRRLEYGLQQIRLAESYYYLTSRLRDLAGAAMVIADEIAEQDSRTALGAYNEIVNLGRHLISDTDPLTRMTGISIADQGLGAIERFADWFGDLTTRQNAILQRQELHEMADVYQYRAAPEEGTEFSNPTDQQ